MQGKFILGQKVWWEEQIVQNCETCNQRISTTVPSTGFGFIKQVYISQSLIPGQTKNCDCTSNCLCSTKEDWNHAINGKVVATYGVKRSDGVHSNTIMLQEDMLTDKKPKKEKENV